MRFNTTDIFFKNKNRLVVVLSDTCSYIDRLGSVDSPRPRNHPFEAGAKFNPLSLFTSVANTASGFDSRRLVRKEFSSDQENAPSLRPCTFSGTLKAALILSCIKQHC